ncbi:hypothetical protein GGR51DRAFT_369319 [Nemania sp. FL0031]|nr:hypothetical protein GGR51DRAFT_369319 [Nemania sp. FL0031]
MSFYIRLTNRYVGGLLSLTNHCLVTTMPDLEPCVTARSTIWTIHKSYPLADLHRSRSGPLLYVTAAVAHLRNVRTDNMQYGSRKRPVELPHLRWSCTYILQTRRRGLLTVTTVRYDRHAGGPLGTVSQHSLEVFLCCLPFAFYKMASSAKHDPRRSLCWSSLRAFLGRKKGGSRCGATVSNSSCNTTRLVDTPVLTSQLPGDPYPDISLFERVIYGAFHRWPYFYLGPCYLSLFVAFYRQGSPQYYNVRLHVWMRPAEMAYQ